MKLFLNLALVGSSLLCSTQLMAYPMNFVGIWKNMNPGTKGIVRIIITPDMNMRMYGACTPIPCDNGTSKLTTFGKSVTDVNHKAALANYDLGFKKVTTALKIANTNKINFEHYNHFVDSSGRQNYMMSEMFKKVIPYEIENLTELE